jgi:hypothetical protein
MVSQLCTTVFKSDIERLYHQVKGLLSYYFKLNRKSHVVFCNDHLGGYATRNIVKL